MLVPWAVQNNVQDEGLVCGLGYSRLIMETESWLMGMKAFVLSGQLFLSTGSYVTNTRPLFFNTLLTMWFYPILAILVIL